MRSWDPFTGEVQGLGGKVADGGAGVGEDGVGWAAVGGGGAGGEGGGGVEHGAFGGFGSGRAWRRRRCKGERRGGWGEEQLRQREEVVHGTQRRSAEVSRNRETDWDGVPRERSCE